MNVLTATTELEAVNGMLMSIGQSPVNTLEVTGIRDVNLAQSLLHNTSRAIQTRGWHFNEDRNFKLNPDINGEISLPANTLNVTPEKSHKDYVFRAGKLYDKSENSYTIDEPVEVRIVWFLDFEDLPQAARDYIATSAARRFQAQTVGSEILYRYTIEDERMALATLSRMEVKNSKANMLYDSHSVGSIAIWD